jgi:hypothetical protein
MLSGVLDVNVKLLQICLRDQIDDASIWKLSQKNLILNIAQRFVQYRLGAASHTEDA